MILNAIGILILVYSFINFKKAYYLFIAYCIFWAPSSSCFMIGEKNVTINMIMSFGLFFSFILNYKKMGITKRFMPFTIPFILIVLSMFLTCFFAKAGFVSEVFRVVSKTLQTYTTIIISWYIFETKEDYIALIKMVIIIFFIISIYGILEFITQKNIFVDYKRTLNTNLLPAYSTSRRGYRIISVFDFSLGAGLNFAVVCAFILYLYIYERNSLPFIPFSLITSVLCFICVILTKSRGDYLYLFLVLLPCFNPKRINVKKVLLIALLIFIVTLPLTYKRLNIITSVFDSNAQSEIKGSTLQMRVDQYNAVKEEISDSPIFGNGEKYLNYVSEEMKDRIKGVESVWLEQLIKHGFLGVIVQIVLAIFSIVIIPYKYKSKKLMFLGIAYWITNSITTFYGLRFDLYYCIIFYFIKTSKVYIDSKNKFTII